MNKLYPRNYDCCTGELKRAVSECVHIVQCPNCGTDIVFDKTYSLAQHKNLTHYKCEIPVKIPSLNEYISACRNSPYKGARMKKDAQELVTWFIKKMPRFDKPIATHFHWTEGNEKRDQDNVTGMGHKVILDALVAAGKIKDDNKKYIIKTTDDFEYQKDVWKCVMEIEVMD